MGFSSFFNHFIGYKFNAEAIAGFAANENESKDDLLNKWKKATDDGTRIDKALELYAQTGNLPQEYADLENVAKQILSKYKDYHACYEQLVVYSEEFRTAGSLDKLCLLSNRKTSGFHLGDFKCFDGGMKYEHKGTKWLKPPFDHLLNSKYNKITIQLSFYAYHLEELTRKLGFPRKCERLFVDMIKPVKNGEEITGYTNQVIPIQYLKTEIELALNVNKVNIIKALEKPQTIEILSDDEWF